MREKIVSDAEIVAMFFARKPEAIETAQEKFSPYLHTVAYNLLGSREDAEECVNDGFMRAWNSIPPKNPERLSAYLAKLVRNLALNRIEAANAARRGGGEVPLVLEELYDIWNPSDTVEERLEVQALAQALNAWLPTLSSEKRAAFVGRCFHMDSVKTIAAKLGVSESKVKSLLFRARKELRTYLEKEGLL